jgi:D-3-phosphoglycerate dehydrogenase
MHILANDGLDTVAIKAFTQAGHTVYTGKINPEELATFINVKNVECLLVRSATKVTRELMEACPKLIYIGRAGVGLDNIDLEAAKELKRNVFNTPNASSRSVAELVIGYIYTSSRHIHTATHTLSTENFKGLKKDLECSTQVYGKTLGVIGYGNIGREVTKLAQANGMRVLIHDPYIINSLIDASIFVSKEQILAESDFITIHISGKAEVLNASDIVKMKNNAVIINCSRGGCVNEQDLLDAIRTNTIAGACIDTFVGEPTPDERLLNNPRIIVTPHVAGSTIEAQEAIGMELVSRLEDLTTEMVVTEEFSMKH